MRLALEARIVPAAESAAPATAARQEAPEAPAPVAPARPPEPLDPQRRAAGKPGAALPLRYLSSREVDTPAQLLERPQLLYPEVAYLLGIPGTVRLRVFIGEDGRVDSVEIVAAQPPGYFEEAAIAAGRALRYAPARASGAAVRSQRLIDVQFDPRDERSAPQAAAPPPR
jgi:protein TonB